MRATAHSKVNPMSGTIVLDQLNRSIESEWQM